MASAQQAARITDPVTHGLGMLGIIGGMLIGAVAAAILIVALPVTAPALVVGLTVAAGVGAVAGGGLAGHQLLDGIQRAFALPSPTTGVIGLIGSPNVRVVNLPAARVVEDMVAPCNGLMTLYHLPIPPLPPAPIAEGAQTIRINNFLAARVTSKIVCGASIKQGALTVYYGGPTQRLLAVFDLESTLLSALGFVAKASLAAMALLTIPMGIGAMATFALVFGGFMAVNYGLGVWGGKRWGDILQGGFGLVAILGGAKLGQKALETMGTVPDDTPSVDVAKLPKDPLVIGKDKLQHIYDKHAGDFGISGNKNPAQLQRLQDGLESHVIDADTRLVQGQYRGQDAQLYVNSRTQNVVVTDNDNNVIAGFKVGAKQMEYINSTGRLN